MAHGLSLQYVPQAEASVLQQQQYYQWYQQYSYAYPYSYYYPMVSAWLQGLVGLVGCGPVTDKLRIEDGMTAAELPPLTHCPQGQFPGLPLVHQVPHYVVLAISPLPCLLHLPHA